MKKVKKEGIILTIFIIIQTIIYVCVGMNKVDLHIDEAYSFGLSNYEKVEIQDNEDFYNQWHTKEYFEDYLAVQDKDVGNYKPVYENQKNDVHPPLYYLILRIAMGFSKDHFSKWTGIIVNIIIYAFITIFMYFLLKKLFKDEKNSNLKACIFAFMSSIILASLSNVVYIRMYSLLTLEIIITILLHIQLLESEKMNYKVLIGIGITVIAGVLTHYYYLFYLIVLYFIFFVKYIKEKNIKALGYYTLTMLIAGITSLIIFPYSIQHMFFGYRGQGVISNLENIYEIIPSIFSQIYNLNYYGFNNLLYIIIAVIIGILIYNKIRKKGKIEISKEKKMILKIIYLPSIFFFIITAIASPWKVLRYFVPVCALLFIVIIYYLYKLLQTIENEKITNIIMAIVFCAILVSPVIFKLEPELLYREKKETIDKLSGELNLPAIYFNSENAGFLWDIVLFSKINASYMPKDIDFTEENIQKIFENKDISNGIIVFISGEQDHQDMIDKMKNYLNFSNCEYLNRLNTSDIYYIHN